jgi:hypothetical protein
VKGAWVGAAANPAKPALASTLEEDFLKISVKISPFL